MTETVKESKSVQPKQNRIRMHEPLNTQNPYNLRKAAYIVQSRTKTCSKDVQPTQHRIQLRNQFATDLLPQINKYLLSVMACSEKDMSPQVSHDWTEARKLNAPISPEYLMVKELP